MYARKESDSQTARVLSILRALAKVPQATVKQLSTTTRIPVSSVYRLSEDLLVSGFVHKTTSRHYGAGPVAVQLAERCGDTTLVAGMSSRSRSEIFDVHALPGTCTSPSTWTRCRPAWRRVSVLRRVRHRPGSGARGDGCRGPQTRPRHVSWTP